MLPDKNNSGLVNTLTVAFLMLSITMGTITLVKMYQNKKRKCNCKKSENDGK
jgi:hypothetical protein